MKLVALVAVLALVACKKEDKSAKTGSAASGAGDCSKVTVAVDAMTGGGPMAGAAADVPVKLKEIMLKRCSEDKWPQSVIDCYANQAKDRDGAIKCREGLPPELSEKLITEIRTVMRPAGGGMMPPGHGAGGAPSGSAGSAAAPGSAK